MSFNGLTFFNRTVSEASGGVVSAVNTKLPDVIFYEVNFDIPYLFLKI